MKPDFYKMTRKELRSYVLKNREDDEAFQVLMDTFDMSGPSYLCPKTEKEMNEQQSIIMKKIKQIEENEGNAA